ncbi:MAG: family 43 glycosylhydrolase, partial [Clostridia bacterium]|nr:family 43 glycosylhydrolase [Clostridia bacterium]
MKLINYKEGQFPSQPDPFILRDPDGKFYIYVTGADGVHCFVSDSLAGEYTDIGRVFHVDGCKQYWAPSVIFTGGKYYMYVSFMQAEEEDVHMQTMHVAESDSPAGPFHTPTKLIAPFSIDSHVVENESGLFIFYSLNDYEAERAGTYIAVDRMTDPRTVAGTPVAVLRATLDEEIFCRDRFKKGQHWHTLEGAFYFREGNTHYIIYSGNCYESEYYYLGYAVAHGDESDLTKLKFTKYPDESTYAPLISANSFEAGTGHNSVIKVDNQYYVVYHGRDIPPDPRLKADSRTARICRLTVDGDKLTAVRY